MHWLESELIKLDGLQQEFDKIRDLAAESGAASRGQERKARSKFLDSIKNLVVTVAQCRGISGCIACHDGLVVAEAGSLKDLDAVAAVTQECLAVAGKCENVVPLGPLKQLLVIGIDSKLAVMCLKQVAICIVSPVETVLSNVLQDHPNPTRTPVQTASPAIRDRGSEPSSQES